MAPSFLPRLVNEPFGDPSLFIPFRYENRALLFDLGDITALSSRDILKITHIFVTHTHMDHFVGFDHVLRTMLGRDKDLYLYGPQGFLQNIEGKLSGYCWNLVKNYKNQFVIHATELHPDRVLTCRYSCCKGFLPPKKFSKGSFDNIALREPEMTIRAVHLDHGTPVLGFALQERFHVNIIKTALDQMGLVQGPWLNRFKNLLYSHSNAESVINVPVENKSGTKVSFTLKELKSKIVRITRGQRLAYITDVSHTKENMKKMIALADGVDHLFVEAAFSDRDRELAKKKNHLTARQAGELARLCSVKQYTLFHHSPRYTDCPDLLEAEAESAYRR